MIDYRLSSPAAAQIMHSAGSFVKTLRCCSFILPGTFLQNNNPVLSADLLTLPFQGVFVYTNVILPCFSGFTG
jgi:hypothetical protein